jgi:L-ascorbate metabolism protein UlaG (beta-lactamase superfamily)
MNEMIPPCHITCLGTATALIEVGGLRLLTDPVFDPAGSVFEHGPIRLVKTGDPVIPVNEVGDIDAVLLSHDQHADNLDASGRALATQAGRILTTPEAASRLQGNAEGMAEWTQKTLSGPDFDVTVTAMPAQHGPDGTQAMTGPVTGFFLEWPGQRWGGLYISGDTILFPGTEDITRRVRVSVAMLHLGCVKLAPMGDLTFSMSAQEGSSFAHALQARTVLPMHYDGWAHFSQGRDAAAAIFRESPVAERVRWLTLGERTAVIV